MDIGDTTTGKSECNLPTAYKDDRQKGVNTVMEYSDYSTEICDDVLIHEDLLKSIGEKMPCEEELYDLALSYSRFSEILPELEFFLCFLNPKHVPATSPQLSI